MYEAYFGLKENPFSIAPDPRYLYMSEKHQEALAHLMFSLSGGNRFVLLTGEVGTGKTTLCRGLLGQLPEDVDVALILNPRFNAVDLLAAVCDELGIRYPKGELKSKTLNDLLVRHLLDVRRKGRRTFLIIDEAQNLGVEVLEEVRLLTNLETSEEKLLQIILIGQPELRGLLAKEELRQLSQRITARYHLDKLTRSETEAYIDHRLHVAGCGRVLFNRSAISTVYAQSRGIPRLINTICDRSLLGAYAEGKGKVDKRTVRNAADEVLGGGVPELVGESVKPGRSWGRPVLLVVLLLVAMAGWLHFAPKVDPMSAISGLLPKAPEPIGWSAEAEEDELSRELDEAIKAEEAADSTSVSTETNAEVAELAKIDEIESESKADVAVDEQKAAVSVDASDELESKASVVTQEEAVDSEEHENAAPVVITRDDDQIDEPVSETIEANPAATIAERGSVKPKTNSSIDLPIKTAIGKSLVLELDMHAADDAADSLGFSPQGSEDGEPANEGGAN